LFTHAHARTHMKYLQNRLETWAWNQFCGRALRSRRIYWG